MVKHIDMVVPIFSRYFQCEVFGVVMLQMEIVIKLFIKAVSIYGQRFVDENFKVWHKEGTLTTANIGGPNSNDSRFIITMGPSQWFIYMKLLG